MSDIAATAAEYFGVKKPKYGEPFLEKINKLMENHTTLIVVRVYGFYKFSYEEEKAILEVNIF